MATICECVDVGCAECVGQCQKLAGADRLYRIDMEDWGGTLMCDGCAADAYESGVFTSVPADGDAECPEDRYR
jgi:hypothetical protein